MDGSRGERPKSALSASLGRSSARSLAGSSNAASVGPSIEEELAREISIPQSLPLGGSSPLGGDRSPSIGIRGAALRASAASSGSYALGGGSSYVGSLGTSFTAGHSLMMMGSVRRPPSLSVASPASVSHGPAADGGLTAPLLPHLASFGAPRRASMERRASLDAAAAAAAAQPPYAPPSLKAVGADAGAPPSPAAAAAAAEGDVSLHVHDAAAAAAAGGPAAAADAAGGKAKASAMADAVVYGIINAIVGLPCMVAFAAVIFSDPTYKPMLGELARFSFLAAAVHQAVFTAFSTLPFAVGQPQDVGIIFLSSMATGVATIGREVGLPLAEIVGTALLTIMVATIVVGLLTTAVAKFKLATFVQYVPLPVVGGYLGYVGYFCLAAGIGQGAGVNIGSFSSWLGLFTRDALIKLVPTLASAAALFLTMTRARSPLALPAVLLALPAAFYVALLATGTTLAEAQDAGWALKPEGKSTQQFWELYEMFNISSWRLDGVYLPALLRQVPKMLGLFFVVTFGSCLDVAAIQADVPTPIDFNRELSVVGLSNIICGLTGSGYTGSYIFSQTIFSMRAGVSNRIHGVIIAGGELAVFLLPFAAAQYLPLYFYGSLLAVFGWEIAGDWLVRSRHKVTRAEYALLLATFLAIMQFELQMGVLVGIVLCLAFFAVTYARVNMTAFTVVPSRSVAVRTYRERQALAAFHGRSVAVGLGGYIFFGSSVLLTERVTRIAREMVERGADTARAFAASARNGGAPGDGPLCRGSVPPTAAVAPPAAGGGGGGGWGVADPERLAALAERAPCFVLLDFRRVLGVDATAAQLLGSLRAVLRQLNVELVLTRIRDEGVRRLLVAHGLLAPSPDEDDGESYCRAFPTLSEGEQYAEDRFLALVRATGLLGSGGESLSLREFLLSHAQEGPLAAGLDAAAAAEGLGRLSATRALEAGAVLFDFDEAPEEIYFVLSGSVDIAIKHFTDTVVEDSALDRSRSGRAAAAAAAAGGGGGGGAGGGARAAAAASVAPATECHFCCGPGSVFGGTDFVLQRPRSFRAVASAPSRVVAIGAAAYRELARTEPQAAAFLQIILLRDACLSEVYAYELLERALVA